MEWFVYKNQKQYAKIKLEYVIKTGWKRTQLSTVKSIAGNLYIISQYSSSRPTATSPNYFTCSMNDFQRINSFNLFHGDSVDLVFCWMFKTCFMLSLYKACSHQQKRYNELKSLLFDTYLIVAD